MQENPGEHLEFPLHCQYRIVAKADAKNVQADVNEVVKKHELQNQVKKGSLSKNGNFQSWVLDCTINDLTHLRGVGADLSAIDGVKMVL